MQYFLWQTCGNRTSDYARLLPFNELSLPVWHTELLKGLQHATGAILTCGLRLKAVTMPQAFDSAWSAVGGGPADLTFPSEFLGHWIAESTLSKIETPLGLEFVPNPVVSLEQVLI